MFMAQVVLDLPDTLVEHVSSFSQVTQRDVETVLVDTLEMMWPAWGTLLDHELEDFERLSDEEVLAFAEANMEPDQHARLTELQTRGKLKGLTPSEQFELLVLMHLYQIGLLRKSQGLAESVRRGLCPPLTP
jgi:hypothetical protein